MKFLESSFSLLENILQEHNQDLLGDVDFFLCLYIYIYILKRHHKEIEKSILHKRMMVKKKLYINRYI